MTRPHAITAYLARLAPLAACAAVLVWHSLQYDFVTDDAYISFVFSRNLAEHGALVFNPGDAVEGYTNFLWTFVLGLLMVAGVEPEISSRVLGTGFGIGTLAVAWACVRYLLADATAGAGAGAGSPGGACTGSPGGETYAGWLWPAVAPALLASSSGFACWSSGGLETQMFTFFVSLGIYAYVRGARGGRWLRWTGPILALAAMTRPEGLLITGSIGVHRLIANLVRERRLVPHRDELACLIGFVAIWAPWYAWRWWYYGFPFPNTYYVKAAGEPPAGYTEALRQNGLYYIWQWARQSKALYAAPVIVVGLVAARPGMRRLYYGSLALPLALAYLAYAVSVGGDFMGLHRFIMPVFVIAAIGCALGLERLSRLVPASCARSRAAAGAVIAALTVAAFAATQARLTRESTRWGNFAADHGIDTPAYLAAYTADRAAIGAHMRACFRPDDFSIVGGAGAQPYHGRMRAIDVFGLVSREIAHTVPPSRPRAGHNKWGPDPLLLGYEPQFVFSCYSLHAHPRRPRLNCNPRFWRDNGYELVTLHIPTLVHQGPYYSFFQRKDRKLECPGLVQ